jgi:hypothetical protein
VAQGVPGRLRPRIFSTIGTTRVVGRQPNAPAAFTPGEIYVYILHKIIWCIAPVYWNITTKLYICSTNALCIKIVCMWLFPVFCHSIVPFVVINSDYIAVGITAYFSAVLSCLGQLKHVVFVKRLETMKGASPEIAKCHWNWSDCIRCVSMTSSWGMLKTKIVCDRSLSSVKFTPWHLSFSTVVSSAMPTTLATLKKVHFEFTITCYEMSGE